MEKPSNWCIEETKSANFGDKRINKRYGEILYSLASAPLHSIPSVCKSWGETIAAYRFMNNDHVSESQILAPHKEATLNRIKNEKVVLIPQDTTEIDFTGRKNLSGIGYLSAESGQGFYLHPSIAVTPERLCLGVVDMQHWVRKELNSRDKRKNKAIEEKETYCWIKAYEAANEIALSAPDTTIVTICDREGDIYELLEKLPSKKNKAYWLVRCQHNRSILNRENNKFDLRLRETLNQSEPIGQIEYELTAAISNRSNIKRHARSQRTVKQEVRACTFHLRPPPRKEKKLASIAINVVHCKEIEPPEGEEAVEWILLTSCPVTNAEEAIEIVNWYLCRWQIEVFFKTLKSGCKVEELQFDTLTGTLNCIAMYMIVAWRILYLTMLGRSCPEINCSVVFEASEWQSIYAVVHKKKPPKEPPTLNEIILMIAKMGGFLGRKSDGYPGPKVMWIGLQRMRDFTLAWETFYSN